MKDFLAQHQVGLTLDPNSAESLVQFVQSLDQRGEILKQMGQKAKVLAAKEFGTPYLAQKMLTGIQEAIL